MKIKQLSMLISLTACVIACSRPVETDGTTGTIKFRPTAVDFAQTTTKASLGLTLPDAGDFAVKAVNSYGETVLDLAKLSSYDESTAYPVGNYTASVSYGSTSIEAFETPCYAGKKDFAVVDAQSTTVSIDASIANSVVRVAVTDAFASWFDDYSFTLTTPAGASLVFAKGETRRAFIEPYRFSLSGWGVRNSRRVEISSRDFDNLAAQTLYTVRFDVNEGQVGAATITISFDDTILGSQTIDAELNDDAN